VTLALEGGLSIKCDTDVQETHGEQKTLASIFTEGCGGVKVCSREFGWVSRINLGTGFNPQSQAVEDANNLEGSGWVLSFCLSSRLTFLPLCISFHILGNISSHIIHGKQYSIGAAQATKHSLCISVPPLDPPSNLSTCVFTACSDENGP
jgi:hypothetical protein